MTQITETQKDYRRLIHSKSFVNNQWLDAENSARLPVKQKYTQELLAEITLATPQQAELALKASAEGLQMMKNFSVGERAAHLERLKDALHQKQEAIAQLICAEAGKPISYARGEVQRALATIEEGIRQVYHFAGERVQMDFANAKGRQAFTQPFPVGVVLGITPFNFPLNLLMHKLVPALAVGCSIILKPSPHAPLTALAVAELCQEAGYPDGAVNVLVCNNEVAEILVRSHIPKLLSFTGSDRVGWQLKNIAGKKRVLLELGGNAAVIVDEKNENLEEIAAKVAYSAFLYAGQICISTQRIVVMAPIYEKFMEMLANESGKLLVGDPRNEACIVGPLIDDKSLVRTGDWVEEALRAGSKLVRGGKIESAEHNIYAPTLITEVNPNLKVYREEAFAPLAIIESAKTWEEAIARVNNSKYGLQAGVYSPDINRLKYAYQHLEVGAVIANNVAAFRIDHMPYGGVKDSGLGREGLKYAMQEMSETRLFVF